MLKLTINYINKMNKKVGSADLLYKILHVKDYQVKTKPKGAGIYIFISQGVNDYIPYIYCRSKSFDLE